MGVLPKQVRPVDVSKVLYELHLLPDRRDMTEAALAPVELEGGTPVVRPPPAAGAAVDWGRRVESAGRGQAAHGRRLLLASRDRFAPLPRGGVGRPFAPPALRVP